MRKLLSALSAVCAIAVGTAPSVAQSNSQHSYVYVGTGKSAVVFLDTNTLSQSGDVVTAWTIWVYYPYEKVPSVGSVSYDIQQYDLDCRAQTVTIRYTVSYGADGDVLTSYRSYSSATPAVPDFLGEAVIKSGCGDWKSVDAKSTFQDVDAVLKISHALLAPTPKSKNK